MEMIKMSVTSNQHYGAEEITLKRAKDLRRRMTKVEKILWNELRRNSIKGYYFRRQHAIGIYIADFYCHTAKLVIEIDGPHHETEKGKNYDQYRDKVMNDLGIFILRFGAEEVWENLDLVIREIKNYLS